MAGLSSKSWYYFGLTQSPGYGLPGEWEHLGSITSLFPVQGTDYLMISTMPSGRYQRVVRGLYNNDTHQYDEWVTIWGAGYPSPF